MDARQQLNNSNYVSLPGFIDPQRAKALADEFREHVIRHNCGGDAQIPTSQVEYNFIKFLELLCEKTPEISKLLGEPVLPTYCYARVYRNGSELTRHVDRDACEISVTLHLDGKDEWPIFIKKPNGEEVALNLQSGDGMLYLGCEAEHWRNRFNGDDYVQVFLHYVRSRGDKAYAYFDKQPSKPRNQPQPKTESISMNLEDYIVVIENALPDDLCDRILAEYKDSEEWNPTMIGTGSINKTVRNADTIGISQEHVMDVNEPIRRQLDVEVFESAASAIKTYNAKFPEAAIQRDSGYELLRYTEGGFYKSHVDSFTHIPRAVSCSFTLTDDFEGGEFAFFYGKRKYALKKGSAILFPSNFQYPHEVLEVTKGTRYSIVTWFV